MLTRRKYSTDVAAVREAILNLSHNRGKGILLMPFCAKPPGRDDLAFLGEDLSLIANVGMQVILAAPEGELFWSEIAVSNANFVMEMSKGAEAAFIAGIANECSLSKVCLFLDEDCLGPDGEIINNASVEEARLLLARGSLREIPANAFAIAANVCETGIATVHILNVHRPHSLLAELFTTNGGGTFVYANGVYIKNVRLATSFDLPEILSILLTRSDSESYSGEDARELVATSVENFRVFTVDGCLHGCAHVIEENGSMLVRHLACSRFIAGEVLNSLLLAVVREAERIGARRIVVPQNTLSASMNDAEIFKARGFTEQPLLPGRSGMAWIR